MILIYIILFILAVYFIFFFFQFINIVFKGYAPFISTNRKIFKALIRDIEIKEDFKVYELGCGRAGFLRIIENAYPKTQLIGLENLLSVYFINKIKFKLLGSRIKLFKKDFFSVDLKEADLIYCYLNNATMKRLGEKFRNECKAGTQVISQSFSIPQFIPKKVMRIANKNIYFYKI
jgi:SAM-dependent methyltransferase